MHKIVQACITQQPSCHASHICLNWVRFFVILFQPFSRTTIRPSDPFNWARYLTREWIRDHSTTSWRQLIWDFHCWKLRQVHDVEVYQIEGKPAAVGRAAEVAEGAVCIQKGESVTCIVVMQSKATKSFPSTMKIFTRSSITNFVSLVFEERAHFLSAN